VANVRCTRVGNFWATGSRSAGRGQAWAKIDQTGNWLNNAALSVEGSMWVEGREIEVEVVPRNSPWKTNRSRLARDGCFQD
jgi:hypothetical protein